MEHAQPHRAAAGTRLVEDVARCDVIVIGSGVTGLDIIGFKRCHRSSVNQTLAVGDDKQHGDCASRTQSPSRDPRCLLW
jgi:hypothetical protein